MLRRISLSGVHSASSLPNTASLVFSAFVHFQSKQIKQLFDLFCHYLFTCLFWSLLTLLLLSTLYLFSSSLLSRYTSRMFLANSATAAVATILPPVRT